MNEKDVLKQSVKVFIGGLIIFSILGFVLKQVSYPLGFILGYAVSVLSFYIIIVMSDMILKMGQTIRFVVIMFVAKMLLYIAGFMLAIKFDNTFSLISVFFGYFVTKITINILGYIKR
ncbi:hypothetical protein CWE04_09150 [Thomasclavelia cocleata]|jgi:uncharacterized membrane protein required for colicin V production|uniref:ATP synthase I chain n=1 Tax=Thomasclavelia cocleata TaxID=69824 RepID=A0A1I0F9L1_9FIRM|nr:ATP synthase subunit I [Thomasclavelia cocleata]MCR1960596.1 ATP synthase subunit I [Thomasclavelia cocleata]NDO41287.1 hypothetical protein [Thomasclavelia cocleata]PJN80324.1 hypothetical protein CWE04_09150 [Thomasclavelia cocleata]SET53816.1 ATP synthase I chain [Thomasclavelia cocleata]